MNTELKAYLEAICMLLAGIIAFLVVGLVIFCCEVMEIREYIKIQTNHQLRSGR